jgi:hypothetical protein
VRPFIAAALVSLLASPGVRADMASDAEEHGDIDMSVTLDSGAQSGNAAAAVRIHASPQAIWPVLTSCEEELKLVPQMVSCEVLETSADGSSQLIRQVVDYSWILPRVTYELRVNYVYPERVSIDRVSGDLRMLHGSWYLERDGDYTVAHYSLNMTPGFWVPHWLVRLAMKHDLPKMLRTLRARAESAYQGAP